jgi:DNA-directed RNA polymerase specialized sigma24 family protein
MLPPAEEVLNCFRLTAEEREQAFSAIDRELARQWPAFVRTAALAALLPIIRRDAVAYFRRSDATRPDAEDLAGDLVHTILKCLFGGWPRGNVGAWVVTIRAHVGTDLRRVQARKRRHLGTQRDGVHLDNRPDPAEERERFHRLLLDVPLAARQVVERLLSGDTWADVAMDQGLSEQEAREMVQGIEWPEGGSSRRRKRRRKNPSC